MTIEAFLDLSKEEIKRRMDEERRKLPTLPGTGFEKEMLKRFENPGWGLIMYLAYNSRALLMQALNQYSDYNGNDAKEAIMEELRQYYIHKKMLSRYQKIIKKK